MHKLWTFFQWKLLQPYYVTTEMSTAKAISLSIVCLVVFRRSNECFLVNKRSQVDLCLVHRFPILSIQINRNRTRNNKFHVMIKTKKNTRILDNF